MLIKLSTSTKTSQSQRRTVPEEPGRGILNVGIYQSHRKGMTWDNLFWDSRSVCMVDIISVINLL